MFKYIITRILIFIPTLFIISLGVFFLSKLAPGDPVEVILKGGGASDSGVMADKLANEKVYQETAERLGLDLPVFYFGVSSRAYPDTLHKVPKLAHRQLLGNMVELYGNWPNIADYYEQVRKLDLDYYNVPQEDGNYSALRAIRTGVNDLLVHHKDNKIGAALKRMNEAVATDTTGTIAAVAPLIGGISDAYSKVTTETTLNKKLIPDIKWFGFNNQYHRWISNFMKGDFGISYIDDRPVSSKIWDALRWTFIINLVSILLAYIISIPIGVATAVRKGSRFDRISTTLLFILYSLPSFWVGTLLIVFFTTPEYGAWTDLFPPGKLPRLADDAGFFQSFFAYGYHLTLPVFCVTYGSLAYISRQMRGGMLDVVQQDYIRTANAKGLGAKTVIWKHAFRNSLFPIITMFAYIFPAAIAGSVAIEVIYSIPGMGFLAYDSIISRDWPVVFTIVMFAAILTMLGNLIADMMYALVDPRVSFNDNV